ncbi:MAG: sigma factor-like helix-turn-helix DNA-binding protein, partial [Fuerstiella sp.]
RQQGRQKIVFSEEVLQQLADAISAREVTMSARREALEQCLNRSPTRSRQLLDLRYIHELPTENISKTVALTADSVRVSLTRIRNALGDCIQKRPSLEDLS